MSDSPPALDSRLYFGQLSVVVVEANELESEILAQVVGSFKVRSVARFRTTIDAKDHLARDTAELVIVGSVQREASGPDEYDFIRSLRRERVEAIRTASIILLAGHTPQSHVLRARDCGASFVIAKPITPRVLYDRVVWLAKDTRAFVTVESYAGPDRRFQMLGPPPGTAGRRSTDLSLQVGEAKAPNMSQAEIDAMLSGKGAARL